MKATLCPKAIKITKAHMTVVSTITKECIVA